MSETILRLPQVISRTGLARSTIYYRMERDSFPQPVTLETALWGGLRPTSMPG